MAVLLDGLLKELALENRKQCCRQAGTLDYDSYLALS